MIQTTSCSSDRTSLAKVLLLGAAWLILAGMLAAWAWRADGFSLVIASAMLALIVLWPLCRRWQHTIKGTIKSTVASSSAVPAKLAPGDCETSASAEEKALADTLVSDGRYLLALRRQIADLIDERALGRAIASFEQQMSIVPAGQVVLGAIDELLAEGELDADSIARVGGEVVAVEPFFLDRSPVTNEQFYRFVAAGGYEEIAIWDEEIWPEVFGLVDLTGQPGPRYWKNGRFADGEAKLPVVGVNWYEAVAYARWVGKRLPSDAEWVKASAWPVVPKPGVWLQRRYPWGNTFDHKKANIWGSGPDHPVPVDHFDSGQSPGGASQMIGNVWEWTSCGFGRPDDYALTLPVPMKSIRGGAFDTYFENQATCNFQSGENPQARKHNIGFRLTVGVCDIAPQVLNQIGLGAEPIEPVLDLEEVCV